MKHTTKHFDDTSLFYSAIQFPIYYFFFFPFYVPAISTVLNIPSLFLSYLSQTLENKALCNLRYIRT